MFLERKASRQLEKLDKDVRDRIVEALHVLRDEGFSRKLNIVKLRGYKNNYRLRVGRYWVLVWKIIAENGLRCLPPSL